MRTWLKLAAWGAVGLVIFWLVTEIVGVILGVLSWLIGVVISLAIAVLILAVAYYLLNRLMGGSKETGSTGTRERERSFE